MERDPMEDTLLAHWERANAAWANLWRAMQRTPILRGYLALIYLLLDGLRWLLARLAALGRRAE